MKTNIEIRSFPKINPSCKYVVWLVDHCNGSTSNPMSKKRATNLVKEAAKQGKTWSLIKTWSCVQSKNHEKYYYKLVE